jgi:predicted NUDIX family NTP pyrophosphohydrolase
MKKQSAGIVLYTVTKNSPKVLLVHPGGPFFAKKDAGAWSIPKGEFADPEAPLAAAKREFTEELGVPLPAGELVPLGSVKLSSGKVVYAWSLQGELDVSQVKSNTFKLEWPIKSGDIQEFPEVDKAAWFSLDEAKAKLNKGQVPLIQVLADQLGSSLQSQTSLF